MSLIRFSNVSLSFGHQKLLDGISFNIEKGQRLGLIGRNGEGKSSLLKLINQEIMPDSGEIQHQRNLSIRCLQQDVPEKRAITVLEKVAEGLGTLGQDIFKHHQLLGTASISEQQSLELEQLQVRLDEQNGWSLLNHIESLLTKMSLPALALLSELSGGMRRRVLLAECLVTDPDLLLLDEPTNHLDLGSIKWLEKFLLSYQGTFILVTHDRTFLKALTNNILEIDRGAVRYFSCSYEKYEQKKLALLAEEEKDNREFDKKLAAEEVWIRQGIKARRTRNEGRVRKLKALRIERKERRELQGSMSLDYASLDKSGKLVFEASKLCFSQAGKLIVNGFSAVVARGDKIGLIGPNGCGKTTLLNLLLGKLALESGELKVGTQLKVAYFDQLREGFDEEKSAVDNIGQGSSTVNVFGQEKHVIGYLQQFLFTPERARSSVKYLSGGEKNRLYLASLFTKSANLLILDEPTNDLDIESLEILESFLVEYPGTVIVVSHDRTFLENVVTSSWLYTGEGRFSEDFANFSDYQQIAETYSCRTIIKEECREVKEVANYEDRKALKRITQKIEKLEEKVANVDGKLAEPSLYQVPDNQELKTLTIEKEKLEEALGILYEEWESLESK